MLMMSTESAWRKTSDGTRTPRRSALSPIRACSCSRHGSKAASNKNEAPNGTIYKNELQNAPAGQSKFEDMLKEVCLQAGVDPRSNHALRRDFISSCYDAGMSEVETSTFTRHTSVEGLRAYARVSEDTVAQHAAARVSNMAAKLKAGGPPPSNPAPPASKPSLATKVTTAAASFEDEYFNPDDYEGFDDYAEVAHAPMKVSKHPPIAPSMQPPTQAPFNAVQPSLQPSMQAPFNSVQPPMQPPMQPLTYQATAINSNMASGCYLPAPAYAGHHGQGVASQMPVPPIGFPPAMAQAPSLTLNFNLGGLFQGLPPGIGSHVMPQAGAHAMGGATGNWAGAQSSVQSSGIGFGYGQGGPGHGSHVSGGTSMFAGIPPAFEYHSGNSVVRVDGGTRVQAGGLPSNACNQPAFASPRVGSRLRFAGDLCQGAPKWCKGAGGRKFVIESDDDD